MKTVQVFVRTPTGSVLSDNQQDMLSAEMMPPAIALAKRPFVVRTMNGRKVNIDGSQD